MASTMIGAQYGAGLSNAAQNMATPREPGVLARADGISFGLYELRGKLSSFGDKLAGQGSKDGEAVPQGSGIAGALSAAEERLRDCHRLIDALHAAF